MSTFVDFFFPRRCLICNRVLASGEKDLCLNCIEVIKYQGDAFDRYQDKLTNRKIENIDVFLSYSYCKRALWDFKYRGNIHKGRRLGSLWAKHLRECPWLKDIDYIVPIPLHWRRRVWRGFNQSEILAEVISKDLGIKMRCSDIKRIKHNKPQIKAKHRQLNVKGVFSLRNSEALKGKHILLIDDVITSSATSYEAIEAIKNIDGLKISLAFLTSHS